jgi:YbgC/YbaW family acyl-CoA thioester hydrolase
MFSIDFNIDQSWIATEYSHVHHGRILSIFEHARGEFVASIGFPNDQLMREGKVLVITEVAAVYKREVKLGVVKVTCDSVEIDNRTIKMHQRIINDRDKVAVEGTFSLMFMDASTRRGMNPPEDFVQAVKTSGCYHK